MKPTFISNLSKLISESKSYGPCTIVHNSRRRRERLITQFDEYKDYTQYSSIAFYKHGWEVAKQLRYEIDNLPAINKIQADAVWHNDYLLIAGVAAGKSTGKVCKMGYTAPGIIEYTVDQEAMQIRQTYKKIRQLRSEFRSEDIDADAEYDDIDIFASDWEGDARHTGHENDPIADASFVEYIQAEYPELFSYIKNQNKYHYTRSTTYNVVRYYKLVMHMNFDSVQEIRPLS